MLAKIKITTPEGEAVKVAGKIKYFVLGVGAKPLNPLKIPKAVMDLLLGKAKETAFKLHSEIITDQKESYFIWVMDVDARRYVKIIRNVTLFDKMLRGILDNKLLKKYLHKKLSPQEASQLEAMLMQHTQVEIL